MAGSNLRFLAICALLFFGTPALAAPPAGSGADRGPGPDRKTPAEEMKTIGIDRHAASFAGTVLDVNNRPLSRVQVTLFIAGDVAGRATTDTDGGYELRAGFDPSDDQTILLWFVAPDRTLMPKELVIQESKASAASGLISKCVPRATLTPGHQFRVYLFDADTRNKELTDSGCLP